jgi:hypothetical protein
MTEADFHYTSHAHDLESSAIAQKYGARQRFFVAVQKRASRPSASN